MNPQVHPDKDSIGEKSDINVEMTNLLEKPDS
jgi:hypothetical protein